MVPSDLGSVLGPSGPLNKLKEYLCTFFEFFANGALSGIGLQLVISKRSFFK